MTAAETLAHIEAVLAAATEGPWMVAADDEYVVVQMADPEDYIAIGVPNVQDEADATFIALARNTYPEALAVVRAAADIAAVECDCPVDYTARGRHAPDCFWDLVGDDLRSSVAAFLAKAQEYVP